jgi:hypothetical protein
MILQRRLSRQKGLRLVAISLGLMASMAVVLVFNPLPPVAAQSLRPEGAAYIIYQRLPFIPKENQYRRRDTGEVDPEHTLVSRLIRYNEDVKRRTSYRLDWQITFADFLGINEVIDPERYPGSSTLQTNPTESDIKAIAQLPRDQRRALLDLLSELYAPPSAQPQAPSRNQPKPSVDAETGRPRLSKPGDAQLLMP